MERDREKKSWRDIDRGRERSQHRKDGPPERRRDDNALSNAQAREARSALEALFSPKVETVQPVQETRSAPRIVLPPAPNADPKSVERRRLLGKLLTAAGPAAISKVADEFVGQGFQFPDDQEVFLQLLEHNDEQQVRAAVDALARLLAGELPKRKHVLDQRLRRIEEHADDPSTRDAASDLRKLIHGRPLTPQPGRVR